MIPLESSVGICFFWGACGSSTAQHCWRTLLHPGVREALPGSDQFIDLFGEHVLGSGTHHLVYYLTIFDEKHRGDVADTIL